MVLQTIIVEDELMARKSLIRLCENHAHIELLHAFENGKEAHEYLIENSVDLILLDIEMPIMSGLELLESLSYLPQVVITSSKKEYAFEAFEYDVADFLPKPSNQIRFAKAIEKAIDRYQRFSAIANSSAENELYIKEDGRFTRLPYDKILYFENVGDYIKVITDERAHVIYGTIKGLDQKLSYPRFLKVHRSFIVNLDKIKDIEDNTLVINKKVIPVSRAHKPVLMNSINII